MSGKRLWAARMNVVPFNDVLLGMWMSLDCRRKNHRVDNPTTISQPVSFGLAGVNAWSFKGDVHCERYSCEIGTLWPNRSDRFRDQREPWVGLS